MTASGSSVPQQFFKVRIADVNIEIECRNPHGFSDCVSYLAKFDTPDLVVSAGADEIEAECRRVLGDRYDAAECAAMEKGDMEAAVVFRKITDAMLDFSTLFIHGAAIAVEDRCYIFSAPSGTGKTTHAVNWLRRVPGAYIVNGDKPLVNLDNMRVYGTPWCGKEHMSTNTGVPLAGLICLERSGDNAITPIPFGMMLPCLLQQCYIPDSHARARTAYDLIGRLRQVPCWRLRCNPSEESAVVAWCGLTGAGRDA